jgi:hypothetical protein
MECVLECVLECVWEWHLSIILGKNEKGAWPKWVLHQRLLTWSSLILMLVFFGDFSGNLGNFHFWITEITDLE